MTRTAFLAPEGLEAELEAELGAEGELRHGRLFVVSSGRTSALWAQNTWLDPVRIEIQSIGDAAQKLKAIQRNWALYSAQDAGTHRRASLIAERLPHVSAKPIEPYSPLPTAPLGSFALLDKDTLLASPRCSSPFPHGAPRFVEDREGPPSRAYLKLWEAFTLLGERPRTGARVIDLGSAPGGWTWALAELGCEVISVDKAPLAPDVAARPNVEARVESAFGLDPASVEVEWVFSDIICYPRRLWSLVERWRAAHPAARFVCSIKRQGEPDMETLARFAEVSGARIQHLAHNRHELTWIA